MKRLLMMMIASVMLTFTGCAAFTAPQSINQRLAYAAGAIISAVETCADLRESKAISQAAGQECARQAEVAYATLKVGRSAARVGDLDKAEGQLRAAQVLLTQLQAFLKERK